MARLSPEETQRYQRDGWLVPQWQLPSARTAQMREALGELLRRNPGVRPEKLVSAHVDGDNGEGARGVADFLALARDPDIVELVSGVAGEDLILWGCHVFCKPAGDGFETPWHQDGHYRPIRPLATGAFDDARAVDIELQPGQMSLHDVYMIHGANANRSAQRRTGVPVNFAHRPLWLVRGVDRHGGNDFATGHRHPGNPAGA